MIGGLVNASARKTTVGSTARTSAISHSPERQRLRVRVVDAEHRDAVRDPVQDDVPQRRPQPLPVLAVEVDVVDVLVALRRVLGVLQRPVRAAMEPLRVLLEPGVVGRALDREVERDLEPQLCARGRPGGRNRRSTPARDRRLCGRPPSRRSPMGCPGRPSTPRARCSAPCGWSCRSGESAGSRRRRSRGRRARAAPSRRP